MVVFAKAFQLSLTFASESGAYLARGPFGCSTLGHKNKTMLKSLDTDKHFSLSVRTKSDEEIV